MIQPEVGMLKRDVGVGSWLASFMFLFVIRIPRNRYVSGMTLDSPPTLQDLGCGMTAKTHDMAGELQKLFRKERSARKAKRDLDCLTIHTNPKK